MNRLQGVKRILRNQNGYSLAIVLMVLLVFSVLGMSVMVMSMNSVKMSAGEREDQAVFYIAESGAAMVLSEIEEKVKSLSESASIKNESGFFSELDSQILSTTIIDSFENNQNEQPTASVQVLSGEDVSDLMTKEYRIVSKGKIGNRDRSVETSFQISYVKGEGITIPTGMAVFSSKRMELNNGEIRGDIILNSSSENEIIVTGNPTIYGDIKIPNGNSNVFSAPDWWIDQKAPKIIKHNEFIEFALPPFPDVFPTNYNVIPDRSVNEHKLISNGNINVTNYNVANTTISLPNNFEINDILFSGNRKLTFDVGNKDISIVVNRIEGDGHLSVKGTGTLTIYLKDNINLHGHLNQGRKDNLFLYIGPSNNSLNPKTIKSSDYAEFNAAIYAKDANIELLGSAAINGHVMTGGKRVSVSGDTSATGNGTVIYAPNAHVNLSGSGKLYGSIISDSFLISGGGKVEGRSVDLEDIPFFQNGTNSTGTAVLKKNLIIETSN